MARSARGGVHEGHVNEHARRWGVDVEETRETACSTIAFGRRGDQPVVLKIARSDAERHSRAGRDAEATEIIAQVIEAMSPDGAPASCPTVRDWAKGFDRYLASAGEQV